MPISIFKILGIIGLILIIFGVLIKNRSRKKRDIAYIIGGFLLLGYSIYIKDYIFVMLQAVFVLVTAYDLKKQINKGKLTVKKP